MIDIHIGDIVEMKKEHPCRKSKLWAITRVGADIKIQCQGCQKTIMMPRFEFEKKMKKIVEKVEE